MSLKRKIYDELLEWKKNSQGSSAIFIEGARRVGKSYVVEEFAKQEYKSHIIIDFAKAGKSVRDIFLEDSEDLDTFFQKLSLHYQTRLYERNSLIVFDEVQQFPFARQLIKYLVADHRYDYIETGSLIRLKKNVQDIVIPSEEEHIFMYPLDFEEFLWALGDTSSFPIVESFYLKKKPLGQAAHRKMMNLFKQYILVGGMPQSVVAYLKNKDFADSDRAKRNIISLYRNDVAKFAEGYEDKVYDVFDHIPSQLSKKNKKFKISSLGKLAKMRSYKGAFLWLKEAMITNNCLNCSDPKIGLGLSSDETDLKCYMGDTGLLITLSFIDLPYAKNDLYRAILFDKLGLNEGMIIENVVAQGLVSSGRRLFFYSHNDPVNRENHMEIDFLISKDKKITPIEVKSSNYQRHSSLDKFMKKFKGRYNEPVILYEKDLMEKDGILYLPLYMVYFL